MGVVLVPPKSPGAYRGASSCRAQKSDPALPHAPGVGKDAPVGRSIEPFGLIIAEPMVAGLHHRYVRISVLGRDAGCSRFLMKTLPRVGAEMALHVLAYNLTRAMNILGIQPLLAAVRA